MLFSYQFTNCTSDPADKSLLGRLPLAPWMDVLASGEMKDATEGMGQMFVADQKYST